MFPGAREDTSIRRYPEAGVFRRPKCANMFHFVRASHVYVGSVVSTLSGIHLKICESLGGKWRKAGKFEGDVLQRFHRPSRIPYDVKNYRDSRYLQVKISVLHG